MVIYYQKENKMAISKDNSTKNMGVDGDELTGFVTLDANEVFVPDGRFRPLNKSKVKEIAQSIEKLAQMQPILVDEMGNLIFGNHRLHACIELGIPVEAKVTTEKNPDKLALMEIDENLSRKELSQSELENHLAERKKLYNILYPNTAKRGAKPKDDDGQKNFADDTADSLGKSAKSVNRDVKRGENAGEELQKARDDKKITNGEMDEIIKKDGDDTDAQKDSIKDLIAKKAEKKNKELEDKDKPQPEPSEVEQDGDEVEALRRQVYQLETDFKTQYTQREIADNDLKDALNQIEKLEATNKRYKERIKKAKEAHPEIKV